jgi:hypothetical protein
MNNDQKKTVLVEDDGLGSFNLDQIGQKVGAFGGARLLRFVTDHFTTREGETIDPKRELITLGLVKVVQKFVDKKLVDTIIVAPGAKMPDVEAMNDKAPREEWGVDFNGNPAGPYARVLVLKLLDAQSMDRYAFVTKSIGGSVAIGDLSDKIKILRRIRGPNATAVVACDTALMKTRFGTRIKRPDFKILRYINLGGDGGGGELIEANKPKSIEPPTPTAATTAAAPLGVAAKLDAFGATIEPPTLKEETEDEVPF